MKIEHQQDRRTRLELEASSAGVVGGQGRTGGELVATAGGLAWLYVALVILFVAVAPWLIAHGVPVPAGALPLFAGASR